MNRSFCALLNKHLLNLTPLSDDVCRMTAEYLAENVKFSLTFRHRRRSIISISNCFDDLDACQLENKILANFEMEDNIYRINLLQKVDRNFMKMMKMKNTKAKIKIFGLSDPMPLELNLSTKSSESFGVFVCKDKTNDYKMSFNADDKCLIITKKSNLVYSSPYYVHYGNYSNFDLDCMHSISVSRWA